jgi:hypothetical protein
MPQTIATATPEQLSAARELLALFTSPKHTYRRGTAAEHVEHQRILVDAIETSGAGEWDMGDAIRDARYYLALDCRECGEELTEDYQLREGYCSRECWVAGGC